MVLTFVIQCLMVQYLGRFAVVVPLGVVENSICLGIGAFTLIWGIVIKLIIPSKWFNFLAMNEKEMTAEQSEGRFMGSIKRSHSTRVKAKSTAPEKSKTAQDEDNFKQA